MRIETGTGIVIYDPVAGFTHLLNISRKTYTSTPIHPRAPVTIGARAHQSLVTYDSGESEGVLEQSTLAEALPGQTLNGAYVRGSRSKRVIPIGSVGNVRELRSVTERWYSDDLGLLMKSSNSDPRFGTTTYELTNIVLETPDATLFEIPADFSRTAEQ